MCPSLHSTRVANGIRAQVCLVLTIVVFLLHVKHVISTILCLFIHMFKTNQIAGH